MRTKKNCDDVKYIADHLDAWISGEDNDPAIGEHHLDIAYSRLDSMAYEERMKLRRVPKTNVVSDDDPS